MINEIEDKNNRRNLYEALKGDFDLGTSEQFEKSMQSAEARKNLWNAIHEDYDVGTFEQFEKDMMGDKVKPEQANHSQPTNAQPNQPQPQQPQQAQFQQSLPITSKVGQTEQGNKQIAQVHNQQSSSQAMPPQATMNAPQPRQQVMSLNDRQKLWTWRNIKPTLSTGQTEQQYNARWNNEVENVKRRNDPDEIAAFNAFQKELAQQQAKVQQQGHAVVETGNQPFQSESGTEVWPISFSRKTIPHNQDYVFTLRAMQQAKGTYDLQYNIKDPEIRRDYEALTAPTYDTYRPTDAILDASPREKNKYYQWYAAYLYSNGGEMPEWLDYTAQLKLRSLNKSNLESEAKQWTNLVERTRNARKFRGSNSVSDWLNEQYNFKSGDPRIINGASYPYLVTRAGLIQTPLVQTTGRATVADNRRAYNELLQSNEQSKANPAQGDVYSTSNIINPERFWANTTKWQDLSESQKAAYKDEADYYNQMLKGQANVGYYNVGNGQNEEVEFLKHNRKQMNEQYNMLTDKERTQAVMKQAERTLNVLNGISHNLNTKLRFSIMGKGVEEDNGIRSVIRRYEKFLEVAPRYLEKRNYSAALQFWNGLTDLNGLTFGLLGVADAVSLNKIANNPPKDLIEKFGGEANAKKVIATAIQLDNMAEEYRQKLDYYGTGYSLGGLTQFGIQAGLPLFKGTEAVGKILTGGMRGLVKKATLRYMPNTAKRLGAKELVQATLAEGTRQAMREGGIGGAAGYVAGRLGVANGVSTIVGKAAQGSVEGVVLSVPHAIANVTNNRTGQANVVEINREGIKVNDQPFTHMNQAPDGKVEADTMLREWSQWVGMRVGEVFMPFSKYVDGKVANVAKGAWNKSVGRFIDGSSFARITETFSKAANVGKAATEVGKYVSGNLKRAGMGGTLTFYAQTNLSEMLNAMTVGDVSWDDIKSDQLDKLWGAFVSNAYLVAQNNLVGTVGYYNQKSNLNKSLAQYDAQGSAAWGETDWNGIKADVDRLIDNDKNLQAYQNGVLANENLSKPQRETISQYIATRKTLQAFDLFAKVGKEKSKPNEFDIRYNDAYIAGTQVKSPDQMAQMRESLDASRNTLANLLGIKPEQVDALFADTNKSLGQIYEELTQRFVGNEKANLPNEQSVNTTNIEPIKRAIDHYCTALSMQRGVSESLITSQLEAVQKLDAKVDAATNKDSGMIERATDDMGRECYVISGNADSSNNTDMVVVRYTEDGRVASLSPKQVTIIQQTDAHELKQKNADLVDLNYEGILNSIVNGKTLPEPNDQVVLYDGKSRGVATIEGIKYEESTKDDTRGVAAQPKSVVVKTEDGRIIELPIDTYRQWVRDGFKHDTEVYVHGTESDNSENTNKPTEGTENATEAPTLAEGLRVSINGNEYTIGKVDDSRVELIDENGKDFHWTRSALDKKLKSGDAEILASNEENAQQKPELHYGDEVELNDPDNGENIRGKVNSRDASDEVEIVTDDGRVLRYSKRELDNVIQNVYNNGEHIWSKDENKTEEASNETDTEQSATSQAEAPQNEPMPMHTVGKGKNAVQTEDWLATTPKRGFDYIFGGESGLDADEGREFVNNKLAEAQKNLDKVKNGKPKMGTSIAAYKEAKEAYTTRVEDAQKAVDYWQSVKAEHEKVLLAERHARDEKDKALHEQAVAEEQQRMQDDARKATEQAELGSNAVAPTIRDKWNAAKKENGDADEITLPNGEVVKGHYVLTESGAASASHQATNGFAETEGFPIDENGQSVNDRDYKRDQAAQQVTRSMATDYDQRALQSPVVVSQEGVVLSGNGRTMAGELAAQDGTDTKYVDYLHSHANKFGFTPEQVNGFKHPRVVFVPNEAMPYNADTFAKFNQREQKSQNNTEMAVKMGKVVNDALFGRIMDMVSKYDTLGEFYADDNATYAVVKQLAEADIIPQTEMAHLFDGGKLSEAGQSMIEGVMIGKVFQANPDAVRQITEVKSMRQAVMTALQDIVQNNRLGGGYNLSNELAEAVNLVYRARKAGYKLGQHVSDFAHQGNLFEYDEGATVADFNNMAVMMLADVLNDGRSTQLKKVIAFYNEQATDAAQGIGDMFVGGVKSKTEIINEVNKALNNGREYNTTATSLADGQGQRNQSSKQSNDVGTSGTDGKPTNDTSAVTAETDVESGATEGEKSSAMGDVVPSGEGDSPLSEKIATASAEVNTEPTEAQKEAGNYKKGHVQVGTFDITIEQPQGSVRKGTDADGKQWESKMNNTYGYIRGAVGVDGDHIDVFLSNDIDGWNGRKVFVVDQYNPDGSFDEHKVMLGFNDADEAKSDYLANYENGWENGRRIDVTAVNLEDFEKWIASSKRKTKPFAEYSSVKNGVVPEDLRQQKADGKSAQPPTREETILRDVVIDHMKGSGLDVLGTEEGQQVLDMANGREVRLSAKQKRALETASLGNNPRSLTVVSSADGAKVLKNVDELANKLDKSATQPKTFIGDVAKALGAKRLGSGSEYATFETKNGIVVTIRLANHNAHVSGFDYNGRDNGISIVISPKPNEKIKNDGNAHIIEYYYDSIKLRRAEGKPLAEIVRSIQQSLYSGDFKDTTGLAEREEVNEDMIREHRVYHGSGADFDAFDHSHMGEGEGAQAFGWGTYVTEVEGIGRTYAESASKKPTYLYGGKEMSSDEFHDYVLGEIGDWNENMLNDFMYNLERHGVTRAKDILKKGDLAQYKNLFYQSLGDTRNYAEGKIKAARTLLSLKGIRIRKPKSHLYTIEIPDDTGKNYLDWNGHPAESLLKDVGSFLESNGFEMVQDSPARYEKGESTIVLNPNATGADLYAELQEALGSDKEASKALSEIGLTGIKYPADYIRGGREDGAKNYVIFNENDAKITDHVRFFKTKNGEAYGFTIGGKIYIDPKVATSETPVHEYAHLWASALKANNAKEWQNVVGLMKGTSVWEEVKKLYPELKSDDEIADEVLATYSGRRGAERLRREMDDIAKSNGNVFDKATAMNAMHRVKQAIEKFWKAVADFLHIHYTSAEQVADQVMKDLLDGVDPRSMMDGGKSLRPETRINIVAAKTEHGFKNYAEAKTWAKEHIARTYSGEETGGKGDIRISNAAVDKYLSQSAVDKSDSKDVHLSVLKVLPDVIRESVDAEQHADYKKGEDGVRSAKNGINPNVTIHRLYGAVRMDGKVYRVKVTLKDDKTSKEPKVPHSYEATKIELFAGTLGNSDNSLSPNTNNSITAANLLKGVEKSYDGGKFFEDYNKIREQFIGEQGAERADHAEEVSTRLDNLSVAREMENDKKDAKAIKMATGWERGSDGKWRYEIPDLKYFGKGDAGYKKAREKQPWSKELDGLSDRIFDGEELSESEYQRFDELAQKEEKFKKDYLNREKPHLADWVENDELFKAYPDLKRVELMFTDQLPANMGGSYNERDHTIVVNTNYVGDIASVLAHEVQHAIQKIEGFASGGNPESMQERFEAAKEEWRARAWADALRDKADEMGEHYNQAAVEKALIDEYKEMGMDNDEWMPNKETRMKGFNYFARGYADRSLDADIKNFRLNESTRSDFSPYVEYTKLGGEVESRNVEHRMNMTPEERRASLAAETEDVSREDQIFLMSGDGGSANSEIPQDMETADDYSEFAKEHGVDVDMVKDYASGMKTGNLQKADIALAEIRRTMRVANRGMKLSEFGKLFRPVQKELAERYGDIETLRQEHIDAVMREQGVMEAARKRAEEEEAKRKAHLEDMSLLSTEELDKRYFDAIENGDEVAAREMLDEAARRKGYDDTESDYQGVGAWSAPSNPGYESDADRRADVEDNAPNVNVEDIALGYSLVDGKYWHEPRKYMQSDATALESVNTIKGAISAIRRGEKDVKVKVYRAVPTSVKEGKLRNGDWVTPSKGYAEMHGNNRLEGKYRIIEDEVPVSELWWDGNDSREWGFDDGRGYKYKNVENNRKLNDLVTRDDNGEIIPPSKRFDENVEDVRFRETEPKTLKGEEALAALDNIFSEPTSESLPKSISTLESFKEVFKHPIRTFLGELVKVKDEVFNKIIREKRSNISGAVLSTIENADFAIRDKDGSTLYIKRFKSDNSGNTYNIVAVNKHGEVEDYVSSVHIKRDGNLRNKIKNGAELLLPQERNTDGTLSRNNSTPTAKVENNPDTSQLSLQEKSMHQAAKAVANEMHLGGNVDVLTSTDGLTGRKKNAKGWYDPQTGRITIVLPNHNGRADVVNTMLHEAVGHYGLRELVGKEKMNEFLDFVFKNADKATRSQIAHNSAKYGWDMRKATEEYMASMAEDGTFKNVNKRWWHQLKLAFLKMLHKLGFAGFSGTTLSDNDLRYLLWRSWKNLTEGPARNIYQVAEDTWRQQHLKVGDFAEPKAVDAKTREQNLYYREERERKSARDEYERSVNTAKHKMNLAWVDSMSGLKLLQDAIVPNEKDLKDWENAYMAENRMSSTNLAEMETYKKSFYKDLLDAEQELLDKGAIHEQVTNYMMAKHGLERNEVLAFRDALKHDFANDKQKMSAAWKAYKNDATAQQNKTDFESGKISWDDYKANDTAIREKYAPSYKKYRSKDYSGLTELTTDDPSIKSYQDQIATLKEQLNNERDYATKKSIRIKIAKLNKEMVNEAERIAENSSSNFEKKYDTSELWNRTNAATKASLTKQYESGLLTDEVYHHTLDMFKNYIPLRGFDDVTSDEVYNYFGNAKGQFGGGIRNAKGRKSKADDPIATIGNMAESAIMQGNRNQMKQHFLKMVLNHPSDAVSVDQLYLHYDAATQEWKPVFAEFDEHDDANAVAQKVEAFNQRMETLCQQKPDEYKKASEAHDIQYKVVGKNINEHQVHVKMQGKDYVLTINGNPEAAQALNGQTNPDSTDNPFIKFFQSTNHFMAAMFTQKNPAFILSNLSRDSFYANSMVWAKESPAYAWKFNKNWGKSLYTLFGLITRQRKGTLNMNDKVDRMYQEFIENGGETGYTFLHSVDDYKNMIAKALKESRRSGWNPKSWLKFLDNLINYLGTWAENTSRFAAYRTSREMGRSIEKSIWDAKEISVNFNKKGAGAKASGKWEDGNRLNVMQAYMSQSAKELYVFWNAGVQGLSNVSRTFGKSKGKTLAVAGLYFAIGTALPMLMAALSQGSGDDDTNYYDLPDWVRRNNLCFYTGKGWVTIPLPIELRAFYGLGELAQSVLSGNEEYTATDIATKMLEQVSQLFPVDFMEGGGSLTSFVPSYAKPIVEAYVTNKDYTGTPIYKDAEYNKNRPEWTKAYKGTNQALVWASRLLNELGGGDDVKKANVGVMDVNPAKIQHLFEGYFGGLGKFVFQTMKVASMPFNEDNRELKNVPIINSFYKTSDERTKDRAITSKFYKYNDEYQKTKELLSLYKKELQAPEYKSKFYDLMYSPEGFSATMMDSYNKQLSAVRKAMSVTDPNSDKYKELQQQQVDIQKQAVKVIEATKGVVNSEDKEMKELYNLWMQDYSNDPKKAEERSNKTIEMRKDIVKRIMDIAKQNKPQKK